MVASPRRGRSSQRTRRPGIDARAREAESVEKRRGVQRDGVRRVTAREGGVERFGVAPENLAVEAKVLRSDECIIAPEIAAQRVEGLRDDAPTLFLVGVRPEEREQFAARRAALTAARDDRENREPAWLRRRAGERSIRAMHGETPKGEKSQH